MSDPSILHAVARATRLREGPSGVSAVLRAVYRAGALRLQDAAREARLPLPVASAVRRELEKAGLLERKHGLSLTKKGHELVERDLGFYTKTDAACQTCAGRGIVVPPELGSLVEHLSGIVAQAPAVDVTLDQAPCTPDTAVLRALLMLQNGALEGRRVLILGDDDSVSLTIGLLGRALGKPDLCRSLVVVDADARWLAFLRDGAEREQVSLETVHHDLRQPLPAALHGAFDVFETDPPYTLEGAQLFLARGREALRGGFEGLGFFSFAQWPASQMFELQKVITALGFAVRAVRPDFNRYAGATVLGNIGQLIELVCVEPAAFDLPVWARPLYTADVNPRLRTYVCADCGARVALGEIGAPATIEALKSSGCPKCGGRTFRRQPSKP
jgi:N4-bis(aminopropyl)spermidine synthase